MGYYTNLGESSPFFASKKTQQSHTEQEFVKAYSFNNLEVKPT